jgi:transcriptional regulator with XRE-family HTH domain
MTTIGHKIKKVRELRNYTQEHLADKLSMSLKGYGKIERDEVDVPFSRLEQISEALSVRVEDLVSFDEKNVFNNCGNNNTHSYIQFGCTTTEAKLYEDKIKLLEEKIMLVEKLNQKK